MAVVDVAAAASSDRTPAEAERIRTRRNASRFTTPVAFVASVVVVRALSLLPPPPPRRSTFEVAAAL